MGQQFLPPSKVVENQTNGEFTWAEVAGDSPLALRTISGHPGTAPSLSGLLHRKAPRLHGFLSVLHVLLGVTRSPSPSAPALLCYHWGCCVGSSHSVRPCAGSWLQVPCTLLYERLDPWSSGLPLKSAMSVRPHTKGESLGEPEHHVLTVSLVLLPPPAPFMSNECLVQRTLPFGPCFFGTQFIGDRV